MPPKRTKKTEEPSEEPAKAKRAKATAPPASASKTLVIEACKS